MISPREKVNLNYEPIDFDNIHPDGSGKPSSADFLNLIRAPEAWNITTGNRDIRIGIIDYGFHDHEDVSNNVMFHSGGYHKYRTHGINVASIASADTDNSKNGDPVGFASIGFNTGLSFFEAAEQAVIDPWDVYFKYNLMIEAALQGCRIINCSWSTGTYQQYEQDIINMITDMGVIVVASSGNSEVNSEFATANSYRYPGSYDNVISVGGSNHNDSFFEYYSDIGWRNYTFNNKVDIVAPAHRVTTATVDLFDNFKSKYVENRGTSFATPYVSGTVALMLAVNPSLNHDQVSTILRMTADKSVFDLELHPENEPYIELAGAGRLDAYAAVNMAQNYDDYEVVFENLIGTSVDGDDLVKTNSTSWWNSGASSKNMIPGYSDGWIEVVPNSTSGYRMFGLSEVDEGASWNSIDYNFYLHYSTIKVYESGSYIGTFGRYNPGDILRISTHNIDYPGVGSATILYFSKNGEVFYTRILNNRVNLVGDFSIYTPGSSLDNIRMSQPASVGRPDDDEAVTSWDNQIGVNVNSNNITKTNQTQWWNSGAFSNSEIYAGEDGWVVFNAFTSRVPSSTPHRMIGLSPTDQGASWNTIKYNIYLTGYAASDAEGRVDLYSYGSLVKSGASSWDRNDIFKIERKTFPTDDGNKHYIIFSKNGTVFYGWEISDSDMNEPLFTDVCLYTPNTKIEQIRMTSSLSAFRGAAPPPSDDLLSASSASLNLESAGVFSVDPSLDTMTNNQFQEIYNPTTKFEFFNKNDSIVDPNLTDSLNTHNRIRVNINPNPAIDFIYITSYENEIIKVSISSYTGHTVLKRTIPDTRSHIEFPMNISHLDEGVYVVTIRTSNRIERKTILIER